VLSSYLKLAKLAFFRPIYDQIKPPTLSLLGCVFLPLVARTPWILPLVSNSGQIRYRQCNQVFLSAMSAWVRSLFNGKQPEVAADNSPTAMPPSEDTADLGEDQIAAVEETSSVVVAVQSDDANCQVLEAVDNQKHYSDVNSDQDDNLNDLSSPDTLSEFMVEGNHFSSSEEIAEACRSFAKSRGFTVAFNTHPFLKQYPHPILGSEGKAIQRVKLYCNFKDPDFKKQNKGVRSTCCWFVQFSFDRQSLDYCISKMRLEHNHDIINPGVRIADGLQQITLDSGFNESERSMVYTLARYNLPLFKVQKNSNDFRADLLSF
jgi:hypothetical protein